jgi:hypothetical protein
MFEHTHLSATGSIGLSPSGSGLLSTSQLDRRDFGPREFPVASTVPILPVTIRDEILDLYAFVFCQGGFRQLGMTFEQFLLVVATVKPHDLQGTLKESMATRTRSARVALHEKRPSAESEWRREQRTDSVGNAMALREHWLGWLAVWPGRRYRRRRVRSARS